MERGLGALAAVTPWVGWLAISPALGFPTLATAAMLNRVLVPREDPGFWLGWALLLVGLAGATLFYLAAVDRGRWRASIASGLLYGAIAWLIAGAVIMPLLGLASPLPPAATPAPPSTPDPMHGSFMMLHLGIGAPVAALVAWLLFGAVLGATAGSRTVDPSVGLRRTLRAPALGLVASAFVVLVLVLVVPRLEAAPIGSADTATRTLATGPVEALPPGVDFISILELPQAPGAELGPHAHVPGFAYTLRGVETLAFADGTTIRVGPGEAGFMGTQATHSHLNADDRVVAAAIAFLIVVLAAVVVLTRWRPARYTWRGLPIALILLIAVGAIGTWNPWSNDWLFFSIRPVAARGAPMPLPSASRSFESPDLGALAAGPYVATLEAITLARGGSVADVGSDGAAALFVLDGRIEIRPAGGSSIQLGARGGTLLQPGASTQATNAGDRPAHLLRFAVTPAPIGGLPTD